MMKREELNENMMDQVNGRAYKVYTHDTDELIGTYTFRSSMQEVVDALNDCGLDLRVRTDSWFDDDDAAGEYMARR